MKTGVVGGGSLGLLWAARMGRIGGDVTLVTRTAGQARLIGGQGIRLKGLDGAEIRVPVKAAEAARAFLHAPLDIVLVTVKQRHLPGLIPVLQAITHEESQLIFWQNGWGHDEQIRKLAGRPWTYAAVTTEGALRTGPAEVRHTGSGEAWIGPFPRRNLPEHPTLAAWMDDVENKLPEAVIRKDPDIRRRMWEKLVINCAINPLTAVWEIPNGRLLEARFEPEVRNVVEEAVRVAAACGVRLDPGEMMEKVRNVCRNTAGNRSSMLQDLSKGVLTEIDHINGAVVRLGEQAGVETPVNRKLAGLVRRKEGRML